MSNWVVNKMVVRGEEESMRRFRAFVEDDNGKIDFEKIIPMPKELNLVAGGSRSVAIGVYLQDVNCHEEKRKKFVDKYGDKKLQSLLEEYPLYVHYWDLVKMVEGKNHGVVYDCVTGPGGFQDFIDYGKAYVTCLLEYGAPDWYFWAVDIWGTKWNAINPETFEYLSGIEYDFDTAWSAPYGIYQKLAAEFPELEISVMYADENIGSNCGEIYMNDGYLDKVYPEDNGIDPVKFACDLWGYDYKEFMTKQEETMA